MTSFLDPELPLLTITETARILKIHTETLRRWDNEGKFKAIKTFRNRREYELGSVVYKYAELYLLPNAKKRLSYKAKARMFLLDYYASRAIEPFYYPCGNCRRIVLNTHVCEGRDTHK